MKFNDMKFINSKKLFRTIIFTKSFYFLSLKDVYIVVDSY